MTAAAPDLDHAEDFYTALLGRRALKRFDPPGLLFFDLGGVRLLLTPGASPATMYLKVENVHVALERIQEFAEVIARPHMIYLHVDDALGPPGHEEWQAFVRDPFGNTLGLVAFQRV